MTTLLSAGEVAEWLGVCTRTVHRMKNRGDFPYTMVAGEARFEQRHIEKYLRSRQRQARRAA